MKKFFEEPTLEMTFFDAENVVITESGGTNTVAYDEAAAEIKKATNDNVRIVSLTF